MKIALVGATGTAGRATAHAAQQAGHEVIALSRATGIDLHTGEGLAEALNGAQVVIDTSNAFPTDPSASLVDTFSDVTKNPGESLPACWGTASGSPFHLQY